MGECCVMAWLLLASSRWHAFDLLVYLCRMAPERVRGKCDSHYGVSLAWSSAPRCVADTMTRMGNPGLRNHLYLRMLHAEKLTVITYTDRCLALWCHRQTWDHGGTGPIKWPEHGPHNGEK